MAALSGSRDLASNPLCSYLPQDGLARATVRASERCELLKITVLADIQLFSECMQHSTLALLDQLCKVSQYAVVEEDQLAKLALFGRERWMKQGEVIFVDGASPEYVVVVMQGQLKVRYARTSLGIICQAWAYYRALSCFVLCVLDAAYYT